MKNIEEIKNILIQNKSIIKQEFKVNLVAIFGSFVRGDMKNSSDIDILISLDDNADLIDLCAASNYLEEKLKISVDLVPVDTIREEVKESIFNNIQYL